MQKVIRLLSTLTDTYIASRVGTPVTEQDYDMVITGEDTDVLKPDGSPLLLFRHKAVAPYICRYARPHFRRAARPCSNNRRQTAGNQGEDGVVGYLERTGHIPYCRATAFTRDEPNSFKGCLPFLQEVDAVYRAELPARYEAQLAAVRQTPEEYVIEDTVFSAATVNRNKIFALHRDSGNLSQGFGVMSVLRMGDYAGGFLAFPKYRVAADLGTGDVLLFDTQAIHGNAPVDGNDERYERISVVCYFRRKMVDCLPLAEELERVQCRKPGDPLWP